MFARVREGDVFASTLPNQITSGPRCAVLPGGKILCTFMANSGSGVNDFVPMAAYSDDGIHWSEAKKLWPQLENKLSAFVSVRNTADGKVCLGGKGWEIACPGEMWWSDVEAAMKENKLLFSLSEDGVSIPEPREIPVPYIGGAEQPGGMLAEGEKLTMIYSPYPVIGHPGEADVNCMVLLRSNDSGNSWNASQFARVEGPCEYAESWIVRLADGRLLVSTWQTASDAASNQYFLSSDDGLSFTGPYAQPFRGQSTSAYACQDGTALIAYNQRKNDTVGVWLAWERFNGTQLEVLANEPVWHAYEATRSDSSGDFSQWTDFAFGEPNACVLPGGQILVTLWYKRDDTYGIRYVIVEKE